MMPMFYETLAAIVGLCVLGSILLYLSRTRDLPISEQLSWGKVWLRVLGWACVLVGGFLAGHFVFAGYLVVILLIVMAVLSARSVRQAAAELWVTIAAGIRHQLPIPPLVEAALEESGTAPRYHQLLQRLRAGMPLEELVRTLRVGRAERTALAIAVKTGRLDETIAKADEDRSELRDVEELFTGRFLLLLLLLQGIPVGSFVFASISRQFMLILEDFGLGPGDIGSGFGALFPGLTVSPALWAAVWTVFSFAAVVGILIYWLGGYGILRNLWPWSQCSLRAKNLVLLNMAQGVRAGLPVREIFDVLINHPPMFAIRRRLLNALEAVFRGDNTWEAMRKSGLISQADAEILAASQQLGDLPAGLETLAALYRDRYSVGLRRWAIIGYLIVVSVIVLASVMAYGYSFGVLLTIISHLL